MAAGAAGACGARLYQELAPRGVIVFFPLQWAGVASLFAPKGKQGDGDEEDGHGQEC